MKQSPVTALVYTLHSERNVLNMFCVIDRTRAKSTQVVASGAYHGVCNTLVKLITSAKGLLDAFENICDIKFMRI